MAIVFKQDDAVLESIIAAQLRPALPIRDGSFEVIGKSMWRDTLEDARSTLESVIPAVGRVNTVDSSMPYVGSAFLVGKDLVMTTRHVAAIFVKGVGDQRLSVGDGISIDFLCEMGSPNKMEVDVSEAVFIHPYFDVAALRLARTVTHVPPLVLATRKPEDTENREIAAIGYPAFDARNDAGVMSAVFKDNYNRKSLMPGRTTGVEGVQSFGSNITTLAHDASTSGGTGGAPIVDLQSGEVLGVQFAGRYLVSNYAVPSWDLARDPRIRQHGVSFAEQLEPTWMHTWDVARTDEEISDAALSVEALSEQSKLNPAFDQFFSFDEVLEIYQILVAMGLTKGAEIATLFNGMPPEFVGSLRAHGNSPNELLLNRLQSINRFPIVLGAHSPLYILLTTAVTLNQFDPKSAELNRFLERVIQIERRLAEES